MFVCRPWVSLCFYVKADTFHSIFTVSDCFEFVAVRNKPFVSFKRTGPVLYLRSVTPIYSWDDSMVLHKYLDEFFWFGFKFKFLIIKNLTHKNKLKPYIILHWYCCQSFNKVTFGNNDIYKKKIDSNHTRMLQAILNKSRRQQRTKQQLYGQLPPITKTLKIRRTLHVEHYWRGRYELISDVRLWTPL